MGNKKGKRIKLVDLKKVYDLWLKAQEDKLTKKEEKELKNYLVKYGDDVIIYAKEIYGEKKDKT